MNLEIDMYNINYESHIMPYNEEKTIADHWRYARRREDAKIEVR